MNGSDDTGRDPPRRTIPKQEAIRHLIHSAIRLIIAMEDPFVVHMLIQSAEKLLIDVAGKLKKPLHIDWDRMVRPERRTEFFEMWRETFNYFKHADRDHDEELPVYDIAQGNIITLVGVITNYESLYGHVTDHMRLHIVFVQMLSPHVFDMPDEVRVVIERARTHIMDMTPRAVFREIDSLIGVFAPEFYNEKRRDLVDASMFYSKSFSEFQKCA